MSWRHFDTVCVHVWASQFVSACGRVRLCINTHVMNWLSLTIVAPLYNRNCSTNKNNPFNLVHLSLFLSLMSDCTKKGQGGLGLGGWVEQTTGTCSLSLSLSLVFPPSLSQWGFKVCFGVQLQLVYSLSKQTQTSESSNIVIYVFAPWFGAGEKMDWWGFSYCKFLITELPWEKVKQLVYKLGSVPYPLFSTVSSCTLFFTSAHNNCDNSCHCGHAIIPPASK